MRNIIFNNNSNTNNEYKSNKQNLKSISKSTKQPNIPDLQWKKIRHEIVQKKTLNPRISIPSPDFFAEPQVLPDAPRGLAVSRATAADRGRRGGAGPRLGQPPREKLHQVRLDTEGVWEKDVGKF